MGCYRTRVTILERQGVQLLVVFLPIWSSRAYRYVVYDEEVPVRILQICQVRALPDDYGV